MRLKKDRVKRKKLGNLTLIAEKVNIVTPSGGPVTIGRGGGVQAPKRQYQFSYNVDQGSVTSKPDVVQPAGPPPEAENAVTNGLGRIGRILGDYAMSYATQALFNQATRSFENWMHNSGANPNTTNVTTVTPGSSNTSGTPTDPYYTPVGSEATEFFTPTSPGFPAPSTFTGRRPNIPPPIITQRSPDTDMTFLTPINPPTTPSAPTSGRTAVNPLTPSTPTQSSFPTPSSTGPMSPPAALPGAFPVSTPSVSTPSPTSPPPRRPVMTEVNLAVPPPVAAMYPNGFPAPVPAVYEPPPTVTYPSLPSGSEPVPGVWQPPQPGGAVVPAAPPQRRRMMYEGDYRRPEFIQQIDDTIQANLSNNPGWQALVSEFTATEGLRRDVDYGRFMNESAERREMAERAQFFDELMANRIGEIFQRRRQVARTPVDLATLVDSYRLRLEQIAEERRIMAAAASGPSPISSSSSAASPAASSPIVRMRGVRPAPLNTIGMTPRAFALPPERIGRAADVGDQGIPSRRSARLALTAPYPSPEQRRNRRQRR